MENPKEQNLRELTFSLLMFVFAFGMGANYLGDWTDPALVTYVILVVLCLVVVGLSMIWWWRTTGTTHVFRMIVLLSSGIGVDAVVQAWSRYLWISGQEAAFDLFRHTWLWDYRQGVKIVALIYLLAVIVSRMNGRRGYYVP